MLKQLRSLLGLAPRSAQQQRALLEASAGHALYIMSGCPYCIRVLLQMRRLGLPIEVRNVSSEPRHAGDLRQYGGKLQAPCLRIEQQGEVRWMYESADIIHYLKQRFG